jgi:exodeoxyribonuclease VII small subunit
MTHAAIVQVTGRARQSDSADVAFADGTARHRVGGRVDTEAVSAPTGPDLSAVPDPATLGYEQARDELIADVQRLEAGGEPLETSLALWERGEALAARCQQWLDGARERLDAVSGRGATRDVNSHGATNDGATNDEGADA